MAAIQTFAAIDIGSFEMELSIYEISPKYGVRSIDRVRHMIALGRDVYKYGKISYESIDEMCRVLEDFSRIMKGYRVQAYRAYATSALREAENNQIILDHIKVRTDLDVKIISNSEQRFISYKAIAVKDAEFNRIIQKGTAIVDIGFGSVQLTLFDKDTLVTTQNLPLGGLRVRELLSRVPANLELTMKLIGEIVDNELFTFRKIHLKDREIKNIIGIGRNTRFLFGIKEKGALPDRLTTEEAEKYYQELVNLGMDAVADRLGVNGEFVKFLFPSAAIYKSLFEMTGAEMIWLPGSSMCDGIAADYAEKNRLVKFNHDFERDIVIEARNLAKRYKCHSSHNQALEDYALRIFDVTRRYHGMGKKERLLLQISVLLHACGKFISMKNSNECAYNIIMSTEIIGLSHLEREIVANVVRYNIRDFEYDNVHLELGAFQSGLTDVDVKKVTVLIGKLTGILRLANSMDRSHKQKLAGCRMTMKDRKLVIITDYEGDITLERVSFEQKADFFEEIYGIRPILRQKRKG